MRARKKPSPVIGDRRRGAAAAIRSFLSRLRIAWLVLIGKALPAHNFRVFYPSSGFSVSTLHSFCWVSDGNIAFAEEMIRRELCDQAASYILYREEQSPNGGYDVSGDLYLYAREASHEHC